MTARRAPRLTMSHPWRSEMPLAERFLHALGAQPSFADAVLGDLAEERARRTREQGAGRASWWYVREALRSAPHLLWNAVRHGGAQGRVRAALVAGAIALVPTIVTLLLLRDAPPARLFVDGQLGGAYGIVLNTTHPIRLAMRVLDANGRTLPSNDVRFEWLAGARVPLTSTGVVTCTESGDAELRAAVGAVTTKFELHCRPVKVFRAPAWLQLVAGGGVRNLAFEAVGPDGRPVWELAGDLRIFDSSVARLEGTRIRPVKPGHTVVTMRVGDAETYTGVSVYEPVASFVGLRADQRFIVAPVSVAKGDTIRWPLPVGLFQLVYERIEPRRPIPKFAVDGPVMCLPDFGPTVDYVKCLVRGPGASLRITHPGTSTTVAAGRLFLEQHEQQP
jgi:hypothetical protein